MGATAGAPKRSAVGVWVVPAVSARDRLPRGVVAAWTWRQRLHRSCGDLLPTFGAPIGAGGYVASSGDRLSHVGSPSRLLLEGGCVPVSATETPRSGRERRRDRPQSHATWSKGRPEERVPGPDALSQGSDRCPRWIVRCGICDYEPSRRTTLLGASRVRAPESLEGVSWERLCRSA
jgi:hypothetical protein